MLNNILLSITENFLLFVSLCTILGLMVGSFLNVVIYRLPIMLERAWKQECETYLSASTEQAEEHENNETFNLAKPDSHCPACNAPVKVWQNIPVLSYLLLKGRCHACHTPISLRYPFVELITGILSALVCYYFYPDIQAVLYALLFTWLLIALTGIDYDTYLLPDNITLPLIWLGLLANLFNTFTDLPSAVIGAMAGYLVLWCVFWLFKLLTGKEGMGFGDFKLLAAIGVWLGWQALPLVIILSSLVGAVIGISLIIFSGREKSKPIPFGPYLAIAGWIALVWGDTINQAYLKSIGL